jgi:type IV pilus assembly protein PilA
MLCPRCGETNAFGVKFCVQCGAPLPAEPQGAGAAPAGAPSGAAPAPPTTPSGSVLGLSQPKVLQPLPSPPPMGPAESSGKAIASLICGFFAWIFPAAVAAIILGHVSLSEIGRSAGRLRGRGMAIAGLVMGYAGLFVVPFILIIAAITIPNLLRARQAANEAAAIGSLRTINIAAITYASTYSNGFPPSLAAMDGVGNGSPTCDDPQLINSALASGLRNGYELTYAPLGTQILADDAKAHGCNVPGSSSFEAHADPLTRGTTGQRSFYTDQTGVIRFERDRPATADSAPLE